MRDLVYACEHHVLHVFRDIPHLVGLVHHEHHQLTGLVRCQDLVMQDGGGECFL